MSIISYLKEVKGEMVHVTWPTTRQVAFFTTLTVIISLVVAYMLGGFDFLFTRGLEKLLGF